MFYLKQHDYGDNNQITWLLKSNAVSASQKSPEILEVRLSAMLCEGLKHALVVNIEGILQCGSSQMKGLLSMEINSPVPVFENQDGGLVDLDSQVCAILCDCMVDIGLLAGGDAAIDL